MLRFKQYILSEAKIDDYKGQETNITTSHDPNAEFKNSSDIIDHFHKQAPGGNVQHTRWMIDQYKKGELKQEDAPDMKETLSNFEKYKSKLPKKRIEQYRSISELKTALHPHREQEEEVKNVNAAKIANGSTVVHNSKNLTAYHVHNTEAAQELGKTPKGQRLGWCTSVEDKDKNMFNSYNQNSNRNFHILHMHNEQYPYRRIGGVGVDGVGVPSQFQDENNKRIEGKDFHDLLRRNPELEKIPAVTNSRHYKIQKASDPTLSKEHLDKLIHDKDEEVRASAASNPSATKEHLDQLYNDKSDKVRKSVIENSRYREHVQAAIDSANPDIRATAAKNPHHKELVGKLIDDKNENVRMAVFKHSPHKEHLDKFVDGNDSSIKHAIASNPNASKEHLDKLVNDKNADVRNAVASNPNATAEHLAKLRSDEDSDVRNKMANKSGENELDHFVNDSDPQVRLTVAKKSSHKEHLDKLADDTSSLVRRAVAVNPAADKDHFGKLIKDKDGMVKIAAAGKTPHKEHLDKLIKDKSPYVRQAVAENPNVTREHLNALANDNDKDVSTTAQRKLAQFN